MENQNQAVMLFHATALMSKFLSAKQGTKLAVYEEFPYWTQEEINQMRFEQYKNYFKAHSKPKEKESKVGD